MTADPCTRIRDELRALGWDVERVVPLLTGWDGFFAGGSMQLAFVDCNHADREFAKYGAPRIALKYGHCGCVHEFVDGAWCGIVCETHFNLGLGLGEHKQRYLDTESAIRAGLQALHAKPEHGFAVGDRVALCCDAKCIGKVAQLSKYENGATCVIVAWSDSGELFKYMPESLRKLPPQPEREATVEEPTQPEDKAEHCAGCKAPLRPNQVGYVCIGSPSVLCIYCYGRSYRQDLPAGSYEAECGPGIRAVPVVDPDPITGPCFANAGWEEP